METSPCCNSVAGYHADRNIFFAHATTAHWAVVPRTKFCSNHCIRIELSETKPGNEISIQFEFRWKPVSETGPRTVTVHSLIERFLTKPLSHQRSIAISNILWHRSVGLKAFTVIRSENANTLQWHHNEYNGVSNHQPRDCLLNQIFRQRSKKTSKLRVTGLCAGNSPVTGEFPAQWASYAENVSI